MVVPRLDEQEQRVLGVLLEKQLTVPASYPMPVAAVRTGANQTSSREPVVDYDDQTVEAALRRLKDRQLVRVVWADKGRRILKHHQLLDEVLGLDAAERALVTVLLLRGPQAPGELRTRTERLHAFADRQAVEAVLTALAARPEPLVRELPRGRGDRDARWVHLLGAAPVDVAAEVPVVDREQVLAAGADARDARVRAAYGAVAGAYADALLDELDELPFERWLLERVASLDGPVVEVGCGPGHVTAHLAALGADARGTDLSPSMVAEARRRFPDGTYDVGNLRALMRPVDADGWAAVLAWYSLIHLAPSELPAALGALVRPLAPGGLLVLALHSGRDVRHLDSWFDVDVDLDGVFHDRSEVLAHVEAAGLVDVEWYLRGPLTGRAETTERLYVLARRPS